jgi:hypothetical protein
VEFSEVGAQELPQHMRIATFEKIASVCRRCGCFRADSERAHLVNPHLIGRERHTALRDVIGRTAKNLVRTTTDMLRGRAIVTGDTTEEFWAQGHQFRDQAFSTAATPRDRIPISKACSLQ